MFVHRFSVVIILFLFQGTLFCQNSDRWTAGSSNQLVGEVVNLVCFISTSEKHWDESKKTEILKDIESANYWIIEQSKNYNISLDIRNELVLQEVVFNEISSGTGSGYERVDWIYRTMRKLGFKNSKQAFRKLRRKYNAENIQVILIANVNGRPYSMRYAKGINKKKYYLEGIILYENYDNGAKLPVTAVTSHELLHLYGAWDLYQTYAQSKDREQRAQKLYPNDIMLRVDHTTHNLMIDELTAWLIGWNTTEPENFEWFRPKDYR